jgi:glycosyltransferase involved in cell wall biosynthesis
LTATLFFQKSEQAFMMVSIIIPMRNEEKFVGRCLDSFLRQIEGRNNFEILCVDGISTDKTREIVQQYAERDNRIRLIENPRQIVPVALNLGIQQSRGDFIMVAGCHAEYAPDYIDKCLDVFERTGADKVGGYLTTVPREDSTIGRAIAAATSSRFGVGSGGRVQGPEKDAVQAAYGGFRRDVFDRFGLYDERLVRNQDLELACRLHNGGGKTIISPEIRVKYYNQSTFAGLRNQAFSNGLWNIYTVWIIGRGVRLKHLVPFGFVLSILFLTIAGIFWPAMWFVLGLELLIYCMVALGLSLSLASKARTSGFLVFLAFLQLHFAYGIGSCRGALTAPFKFRLKRKQQHGQA